MLVSLPAPAVSPLWAFSWRVYQRPSVAAQLLQWQDDADIWINDWLFALWQAGKGNTVCPDYRPQIADWNVWRNQVIRPWRDWRRQCQDGPVLVYQRAKAAELALEWCDQAFLYRHRKTLCMAVDPGTDTLRCLEQSLQRLTGWSASVSNDSALVLLELSDPDSTIA